MSHHCPSSHVVATSDGPTGHHLNDHIIQQKNVLNLFLKYDGFFIYINDC